jgi:small-conductance mechanosensitive channel/CRP-like cAMP-binding protein
MDFWSALTAELRDDRTALILGIGVGLLLVNRALAVEERQRGRSALILLLLHLMLVPIAAALRADESPFYRETRFGALVFETFAIIGLAGVFVFSALLPRLKATVSRILQDVIVAGSSIAAVFTVGSHAGLNLSGLIATSAVLTAVIGLAFQDTLGNVVGGLALQLDESVRIGDWVKVGDVIGKVTEIRWRYTAVETRNWETVILPNSILVKGQVLVLGRRAGAPVQLRRWVYFNVDFRYPPNQVIAVVNAAIQGAHIERVAETPTPNCQLMDLDQSYGRYALRYWLTDIAVDDPTDSLVRTRIYFALRRASMPLSMPAHAVFLTEDSDERKERKGRADHDKRVSALGHVPLFAKLAEDERNLLVDQMKPAPFVAGEVITRQGAEAHWLYIIVDGEASVRVGANGNQREVARLHSGDFFGEMSLLTGQPRSATIVAEVQTECYRLGKDAFQSLLSKRPEIAEHIADVLAARRMELVEAQEQLGHDAERERMRVTRTDLLDKIRSFFALDDA